MQKKNSEIIPEMGLIKLLKIFLFSTCIDLQDLNLHIIFKELIYYVNRK